MTNELEVEVRTMQKQKGGRLSESLKPEFIQLCRDNFNVNPDMECGKCIYKHIIKLYDKYFK
jgi:hypothetical protein